MSFKIRRVEYFYAIVTDDAGGAYELLARLADLGVNLLAFTGVPVGPAHVQLTLFPEDAGALSDVAGRSGLDLDGPHSALLAQGDDRLGAVARIHRKLAGADVNVFASTGVTDGTGSFGYVLYVRPEKIDRAVAILADGNA